jgi:hypothetical protein
MRSCFQLVPSGVRFFFHPTIIYPMLNSDSVTEVFQLLEDQATNSRCSEPARISPILVRLREIFPRFIDSRIELKVSGSSGLGFFASENLSRGTCVLIDHPVISVLDCDDLSGVASGFDGGDSLNLLARMTEAYTPEVEDCLRALYPIRTNEKSESDSGIEMHHQSLLDQLRAILPVDIHPDEVVRAVQLNSLGFYTFPELCSYNEHFRFLTGTGLYKHASMFNHSCDPNVNHYSIGDVTIFRLIRDVQPGEQLCISYIGSDLLCETRSVRHEFLSARDFTCMCSKCACPEETEDPWVEELDLETRISIRLTKSPLQRTNLIRSLQTERNFVTKDGIELLFMLAREEGPTASAEWDELLRHAESCQDFSSVVIWMHYMAHTGYDASLVSKMARTSLDCLGEPLGELQNIGKLFSISDFPISSPLRSRFEQVIASFP